MSKGLKKSFSLDYGKFLRVTVGFLVLWLTLYLSIAGVSASPEVYDVDGRTVYVFTDDVNWSIPEGVTAFDLLVVGGGGGGGTSSGSAGGGGAGGLVFIPNYEYNESYADITIGAGGGDGSAGSNTLFGSEIVGLGGGRGAVGFEGTAGGSAGGAKTNNLQEGLQPLQDGLSGQFGFGNNAGNRDGGSTLSPTGAGGAGEAGEDGVDERDVGLKSGDGLSEVVFDGVTYNFGEIFGTNYGEIINGQAWFGGGGASHLSDGSSGTRGLGGGASGTEDGMANTGGGGGGGGDGNAVGGTGGDGIVMLSVAPNARVRFVDSYFGDDIDYDVVIENSEESFSYSGMGSIETDIEDDDSRLWNISVSSSDNGGYFDRSFTNYNFSESGDLNSELFQFRFNVSNTVGDDLAFDVFAEDFYLAGGNGLYRGVGMLNSLDSFETGYDGWTFETTSSDYVDCVSERSMDWASDGDWSVALKSFSAILGCVGYIEKDMLATSFEATMNITSSFGGFYVDANDIQVDEFIVGEDQEGVYTYTYSGWDVGDTVRIRTTRNGNIHYIDEIRYNYDFNNTVDYNFENLGYFNQVVTSNIYDDGLINVSLVASRFGFELVDFAGNTLDNFDVEVNHSVEGLLFGNETTFFQTETGEVSATFTGDFFSFTENFTLNNRDDLTQTYEFVDTNLTIYARDIFNNDSITNFSGWVSNPQGFNETFNTTTGFDSVLLNKGYNYTVFVESDGWVDDGVSNKKEVFVNDTMTVFMDLYLSNSITFRSFDNNADPITDNVNLDLRGDNNFEFSFTGGEFRAVNITPDTYRVIGNTSGFNEVEYIVSLGSGSFSTLDMYFDTYEDTVLVRVRDRSGRVVEGATVTFMRFIDGDTVTVYEAVTDLSGNVLIPVNVNENYIVNVVSEGFATFSGTLVANQDEYQIILEDLASDEFESLSNDIKHKFSFDFDNVTRDLTLNFDVFSRIGNIENFWLSAEYDGESFNTSSNSVSGGVLELVIPDYNSSVENPIPVTLFIRNTDGLTFRDTFNIWIDDAQGRFTSILNVLGSVSGGQPFTSLLGALLVSLVVVGSMIVSNNIVVAGSVGFVMVILLGTVVGLFPVLISAVVSLILALMMMDTGLQRGASR